MDMVLGFLYKKAIKGMANQLKTDPKLQNELKEAVISALSSQNAGQNQLQSPNGAQNQEINSTNLESTGYEQVSSTVPEGYGLTETGDEVLDGYLEQFRYAVRTHDPKGIKFWGDQITQRQRYLRRAQIGYESRIKQLDEDKGEQSQQQFDLGNLAPVADQLASELLGAISPLAQQLGFSIPEQIRIGNVQIQPARFLADQIRQHPDAIARVLQSFQQLIGKYMRTGQGGQVTAQAMAFDPSRPETWPAGWIQAGRLFGGGE